MRAGWCTLLVCAALSLRHEEAAAGRTEYTFESDTSFSIAGRAALAVDNPVGDVRIVRSQSPDIVVYQFITIPASDSVHAEDFLDEVEVRYQQRGSRVRIEARVPPSRRERLLFGGFIGLHDPGRGRVDFEIETPGDADLELLTTSGEIEVQGVRGEHRFQSGSGDLWLTELAGAVEANSKSGNVQVVSCHGGLRLETSAGDIRLREIDGTVDLTTTSGDITGQQTKGDMMLVVSSGDVRLDGLEGHLNARTTSGNILARMKGCVAAITTSGDVSIDTHCGEGGRCELQSGSGDISLSLSDVAGAEFEIRIGSGDVDDDLGVDWTSRSRRARYGRHGSASASGPVVRVETGSGNIHLGGGR